MSVANEIKIKCICICEFVNPIDALARIEIELTCKTANCALRFAALATPHATCNTHAYTTEPRLSTFACVLLPLCFMQHTKFATVCERFFLLGDSFAMATKFNCFLFLLLPSLASLQSSYEMLRTKRWLSSLAKWSDWHTDQATDGQAESQGDKCALKSA